MSSRQRARYWPASYDPAPPPPIPATTSSSAVILRSAATKDLSPLFTSCPHSGFHSRMPHPSLLRRAGGPVEARPTTRAAAAFVAAAFRPPSPASPFASLLVVIPTKRAARRGTCFLRFGSASADPRAPPAVGCHPERSEGSLFDFNFLPRTPIQNRVAHPSLLRRVGGFVEAPPLNRAAQPLWRAAAEPPLLQQIGGSFPHRNGAKQGISVYNPGSFPSQNENSKSPSNMPNPL